MKDILISGASVAGPTLAWWLRRAGFRPTIVERVPGPARGGHAVDVRGAALDVLDMMDVRGAVFDRRMRMKGVSIVDETGGEVWRSETMTISGGSFDNADIEIFRDRLSRVLVESLAGEVPIVHGDSIAALKDGADGVEVTFTTGETRRFDLVFGADGLRSNVRRLAFGDNRTFLRPFDVALAPFSAPNMLGLEDWQISYRPAGGDGYMVYTAPGNEELRVCFNVPVTLDDLPADRAAQMALVRERCAGMGWETPRFVAAMEDAPDFYLGFIAQVRMDHWSTGRIALVGDAAYCPSPYTGQGSSLAIVGAYILARELARMPDDHRAAFVRYEDAMRPFVEVNQSIADLTRDDRFNSDPTYYTDVIEPFLDRAKSAIDIRELAAVKP